VERIINPEKIMSGVYTPPNTFRVRVRVRVLVSELGSEVDPRI